MRSLPEAAAGGSRQQPEASGKSFEAAGKSFEAAGKSFEASGKSFEVQASGRGQRQARASFSWPGISFFSIAHACCLQLLPAASKLLPEAAASEAAGKSSEAAGRSCRQELNSAGRHEATTLAPSLSVGQAVKWWADSHTGPLVCSMVTTHTISKSYPGCATVTQVNTPHADAAAPLICQFQGARRNMQ